MLLTLSAAHAMPSTVRVANAEDLAPTPDGRWVFAGSGVGGPVKAGSLARIDARSGQVGKAYPLEVGGPSEIAGCPGEVPAAQFEPHGLALSPRGNLLYVVNHGHRESLEIFRVAADGSGALTWIGCAPAPEGYVQNSVTVAADGAAFVTMWPTPVDVKTFSDMIGKVFTWSRDAGWRELEHSDLPTPNGILATPDGKTIFVAAYIRREVVEFSVGAQAVRARSVKLSFMPDNLRWGPRRSLLVAGQNAPMSDVARCAGSADAECDIPAAIAVIDPARFAVTCERPVPLSFATTAVAVRRRIWVSQFRGDAVLRLSAHDLSRPACGSTSQPTESNQ
jgi:sugar lactone lactonase YvrE